MINFASGRPCNRMSGGGIPLHRRCETGINIGRSFRHQADLQAAAATDQGDRLSLLAQVSIKAVVSSVWCEREATTTTPWCPIGIGRRMAFVFISSIEG